ncbi:MAG: stage II sporulation protein M [Clostridiaceae bacterium]|nr:stage II sporulation protein M [Clostridiaceae bacterium]
MQDMKINMFMNTLILRFLRMFDIPFEKMLIPVVFIVFGILLGCISSNYLNASRELEMERYFTGFVNMVGLQTVDRSALFARSFSVNTKVFLLLLFMSISVIGIPFIYAILAVKGFIVGFTAGITAKVLGAKGLAVILCLILPKELILLTAYMIIAVVGVSLCSHLIQIVLRRKSSGFEPDKYIITRHLTGFIPCYILLILGCFMEAYICPVLLKAVL